MFSESFSILAIEDVPWGAFCFVKASASCSEKHLQSKPHVGQSLSQLKNPDLPKWEAHWAEQMQAAGSGCPMEPLAEPRCVVEAGVPAEGETHLTTTLLASHGST